MVEEKKDKVKEKGILVVGELPKKDIRIITDEDNNEYALYTVEEALTEILRAIKKIEGSVV